MTFDLHFQYEVALLDLWWLLLNVMFHFELFVVEVKSSFCTFEIIHFDFFIVFMLPVHLLEACDD